MHTLRSGPIDNCPDLPRRSLNSTRADFKTKIFYLVFQKFALMKSPIQLGLLELFQCPPKVLPMLVHTSTEDQYIIKVCCYEFVQVASEDLIHQPLERGWCIRQPKRHDKKLEVATVCSKSCLLNRRFFHRNLVVSRCEVQLREKTRWPGPTSQIKHQCEVGGTDP